MTSYTLPEPFLTLQGKSKGKLTGEVMNLFDGPAMSRAYADGFAAGAASRDAEVARLKTVPMKYRRMEFNAQLQKTNTDLMSEVETLKRELREGDDLRERLSDILTRSVNAIRGEPEPLSLHSWHDLPELIEALLADALRYRFMRESGFVRVGIDADSMDVWPEYSHDALDTAIDKLNRAAIAAEVEAP